MLSRYFLKNTDLVELELSNNCLSGGFERDLFQETRRYERSPTRLLFINLDINSTGFIQQYQDGQSIFLIYGRIERLKQHLKGTGQVNNNNIFKENPENHSELKQLFTLFKDDTGLRFDGGDNIEISK